MFPSSILAMFLELRLGSAVLGRLLCCLITVSILATCVPALRATRVDPIVALRHVRDRHSKGVDYSPVTVSPDAIRNGVPILTDEDVALSVKNRVDDIPIECGQSDEYSRTSHSGLLESQPTSAQV